MHLKKMNQVIAMALWITITLKTQSSYIISFHQKSLMWSHKTEKVKSIFIQKNELFLKDG